MKRSNGIILIVVLLFLQIIAVMGLFAIKLAWLETKESQYIFRRHTVHSVAEQALYKVEVGLEQAFSKCHIPVSLTTELLARPVSWWQTEACEGAVQAFKYYYVVEFLGADPCAEIQVQPSVMTANYFRITLMGIMNTIKLVLQSTIVTANQNALSCNGTSHAVLLGRQMLREINA